MFTAEELENWDIFPKKITLAGLIKFYIYFIIMFTAFIFLMSVYTGRDVKHIISFDTIKFGPNSELLEQLYLLDSKFNYNLQEKYNFNITNSETDNDFIKEYVSQSLPCIIKNLATELPAYKLWANENLNDTSFNSKALSKLSQAFKDIEFIIEVKSDPQANYIVGDFNLERHNYLNFYEKATKIDKFKNYFINDHLLNESTYSYILLPQKEDKDDTNNKYIKNQTFNFTKNLEFKNIKYSEGFSETITASHYEKTEQIICQLIGTIDIIIIPQLYRYTLYNFKKGYGPTNFSPINFFESDFGRFPNFSKAHRLLITLNQSDCIYIPSFWWYSIRTQKQNHFMFLTFHYNSHSKMIEYLIKNIEKEEI